MNTWFIIRLVLVAFAFLGGVFSTQPTPQPDGVSAGILLGIFAFGILGMLFVVGIQRVNPRTASTWRYPSWAINPFLLREPLQFFHLGGFFMLAAGAGNLLRILFVEQASWFSALTLLAFGAGILGGVYACTVVYRGKMARA